MPELTSNASSSDNQANNWPSVSVLMPVRNEAQYITRSLEAILAQEYPGALEVLVVDGMSDDGTRDIVTNIAAENPQVRLLDNPGRLVAIGLDRGAARARGDIFVRVDGRAFLPPGYVRRCVQLLAETGAANVGGTQVPLADTVQGRAIAAAMASPFGVGTARFRFATRPQQVDTVYLGAWPRASFEQAGGFDESLVRNQDYEFNYRFRQAGGTILYSPELRVAYYGRPTLSALWRQYYDYGFYRLPNLLSHECFDFQELRVTLEKILSGELGTADGDERKELIDHYLSAQEGPLACERMVDVLEGMMEGRSELPKPPLRDRLAGWSMSTVRTLIKRAKERLPDSHNRPEFQNHRYPEVSLEEIRARLFRFQRVLGDGKELKVEQISRQFFEISG